MWEVLSNPLVIAVTAAAPSIVMTIIAYRKSVRLDRRAEATGVADFKLGAFDKVIDGLNELDARRQKENERLQKDNDQMRVGLAQLTSEYTALVTKYMARNGGEG